MCIGKPAVKHKPPSPCYPVRMDIFLIGTFTILIVVFIVDTSRKRNTYLCQQVKVAAQKPIRK